MERTARLHRLYAMAIIAILLEVVAGHVWMAGRRRDLRP